MASKDRIVHLIITLNIGGCEKAMLRLLPRIDPRFENVIVTLRKKGPLAPAFEEKGIRVIAIGQKNAADFFALRRLTRTIQDLSPNILITHLFHADVIGRLFLQYFISCPVVSWLGTTYNYPRYWPARLFERLTHFLARGYIANSQAVKHTYITHFKARSQDIVVIPHAIDLTPFQSAEANPILRESLGLGPNHFALICVANLHPNKGHRYLIEAVAKLLPQHPEIRVLLVGDGEERPNLLHLTRELGIEKNVHFLGQRSDVPQLLKIAHAFVLPTFFEGLSNAIMEAMASGLPIISTDIPENRELIITNTNGLLVPVRNAPALARAIDTVMRDRAFAASLVQKAQESVTQYSLEKTIGTCNAFFSHLATTHHVTS